MGKCKWTEAQVEELRRRYANTSTQELAELFGMNYQAVANKAFSLGLKKPKGYLQSLANPVLECGKKNRFQKGYTPYNKGVKMPETTYVKVARTMFKKGHSLNRIMPIGYERISKDGYVEIKTEEGFKKKQRHVWEQTFGAIPANHNIIFLDGDNRNFSLDNLAMISKADNARRNGIKYSPEYKEVLGLLKQLKNKIADAKKHIRGLA